MEISPIAHFHSPFPSKFGIPKQSGIIADLPGRIVFEPAFRDAAALRCLEEFSHLWIIWSFSANRHAAFSPLVRPPRLGGNERVGVFASRSPYRPNPIGLSCVRLDRVEQTAAEGPVIHVLGADLMDGTPVYDIKPYVSYADSHPEARSGFVDTRQWHRLSVHIPEEAEATMRRLGFTEEMLRLLRSVLAEDPRPQYQRDPDRVYGMTFSGVDVRFRVSGDRLTVTGALPLSGGENQPGRS